MKIHLRTLLQASVVSDSGFSAMLNNKAEGQSFNEILRIELQGELVFPRSPVGGTLKIL